MQQVGRHGFPSPSSGMLWDVQRSFHQSEFLVPCTFSAHPCLALPPRWGSPDPHVATSDDHVMPLEWPSSLSIPDVRRGIWEGGHAPWAGPCVVQVVSARGQRIEGTPSYYLAVTADLLSKPQESTLQLPCRVGRFSPLSDRGL